MVGYRLKCHQMGQSPMGQSQQGHSPSGQLRGNTKGNRRKRHPNNTRLQGNAIFAELPPPLALYQRNLLGISLFVEKVLSLRMKVIL